MQRHRKSRLITVIATRHARVLAALDQAADALDGVRLERREALSVDGAFRALDGAHLAIVDVRDLAGAGAADAGAALDAALRSPGLVTVDGATFALAPQQYLETALAAGGLGALLPPRRVAFTALAGGVGKTTLALATALAFHRATGLPAAVIELSPGPSALLAVTGAQGPDLYRAVTQGAAYPTSHGVTLVPLAWDTARLLPEEQIRAAWETVAAQHIYTAFDAPAWHPRWEYSTAERVFVLADHRPDAQVSAVALLARLREDGADAALGLNRAGLGGRVALPEAPAFALKAVRDPLTLGAPVLKAVYPGWRGR